MTEALPRTVADEDRARVDAFVARHFGLRGTLGLHRHAIGLDLLRAPANVALAPVFLATRIVALLLVLVRLRAAGRWLASRRILFLTAVARVVEKAVMEELVAGRPASEQAAHDRVRDLVGDYVGIRSAVAEIFTTGLVLLMGFVVFRVATPGVISLAPIVSERAARAAAVADFPLGTGFGGLWYGVFPVALPVWWVVAVGIALALVASLVTTFAGVIADPLQAALGIHRRRLLRLLERIDNANGASVGLAREHILARMADITDAGVSLLRFLRP